MMVLSSIGAFLSGVSFYLYNEKFHKASKYYKRLILIFSLVALISCLYLGVSIYRIKKLIRVKQLQVNTRIMVLHAVIFVIYVVINVFYAAVAANWKHPIEDNIVAVFYVFGSVITQVMICYIFLNMGKIQFVPVPADLETDEEEVAAEEAIEEVRVERTDSEFDLQLRMWQQFMRVAPSSVYRRSRTSTSTSSDSRIIPEMQVKQ